MNSSSQLTFAQIFGAVFRHKFKAALMFLFVMALVIAAFLAMPRKYGSEGRMFVQLGRANSGLDPTPGSTSVSIQDTRETEIRSVLEIVKSRAILEQVVDIVRTTEDGEEIPLSEDILKTKFDFIKFDLPTISFGSAGGSDDGLSAEEFKRLRRREIAIKKLEKAMTVDVEKKNAIISVYVKASSASLAQRIVDSIIDFTRKKHLDIHKVKGSAEFFMTEYNRQEQEVLDAVLAQQKFRAENDMLSIGGRRNTLQMVEDKLASDLINARVAYQGALKSHASLVQEMAKVSEKVEIPTQGVEKRAFENTETSLMALKQERTRLETAYSQTHPRVIEINKQIRLFEAQVGGMNDDRTESAYALNPVFEKVKVDLVRAISMRDDAKARLATLEEQYEKTSQERRELGAIIEKAARLQFDVDAANQFLSNYRTKLGEAKVIDQLDANDITDVVVAQEATFVVKHISPRGSIMLPCGFVAACLAALATALFFERNRLSAGLSESEVEQILDLPVLVTLPRVFSTRNMVN